MTQRAGSAVQPEFTVKLRHLVFVSLPILFSVAFVIADEPRIEPNVLVDVSAALINAAVMRPIDRLEPVNETILDTPVCGISRTLGGVRAELVPDAHHGIVDVVLEGCVYSRTVGSRGTIRIHTLGTTPIEIRRRIVIGSQGIRICAGPSQACATTELIDVCSVMDMDALAICTARRGFERNKCAAEQESSCKTAFHAGQRLEEDLTPPLRDASVGLGRQIAAFRRAGLSLKTLEFDSTATALQGRARFSTPGRAEPIPVSLPPDFDLAVRVHESVATEAAQTEFGGRSFPVSGTSKIYAELTRGMILDARKESARIADLKVIEKLLADLAGTPVIINLPKTDPLIVKFANQGFQLEAHVASIRKDMLDYAGLRIKAAYQFENTKDGVYAIRKGKIEFIPNKAEPGQKLAELPADFRFTLESLFGEFMKERLVLAPIPLPAEIARLGPPRAYARNGWFALVWKLRPSEVSPKS